MRNIASDCQARISGADSRARLQVFHGAGAGADRRTDGRELFHRIAMPTRASIWPLPPIARSWPTTFAARCWKTRTRDFTVDVVAPATAEDRAALLKQVQSKAIDGLLSIESSPARTATATYTSQSSGDFITNDRLETALNQRPGRTSV